MKKDSPKERGQIIEALPSLLFRVQMEAGQEVLAHLAGKLKMNKIKVLPGDKVLVELTPYDPRRGIITYRLK